VACCSGNADDEAEAEAEEGSVAVAVEARLSMDGFICELSATAGVANAKEEVP